MAKMKRNNNGNEGKQTTTIRTTTIINITKKKLKGKCIVALRVCARGIVSSLDIVVAFFSYQNVSTISFSHRCLRISWFEFLVIITYYAIRNGWLTIDAARKKMHRYNGNTYNVYHNKNEEGQWHWKKTWTNWIYIN